MKIHQIQQISESHCGPAVLQMLLDAIGIEVTQNRIVEVLGVEDSLEEHGVRPEQLGSACTLLAPEAIFWYKYHSTLEDISLILDSGFVVGIEWQGLFYQSEEEERDAHDEESDFGHYSIISHYDEEQGQLIMVDPYKDFANQDRIFDVETFGRRWWDTNEVRDPFTGKKQIVRDEQLLFFVTPKDISFSTGNGFRAYRTRSSI